MSNFEKPLEQFTKEELQQRINQWDPRYGALALYELQRRQQEENSKQISTLVEETRALKDISNKNEEVSIRNTRSANKLAVIAIVVTLIGIITQTILSINRHDSCADFGGGDIRCTTWIEAGVMGTYIIPEHSVLK